MSKHTPGPWEIVASLAGNDRIIVEAYGFGAIAVISLNGAPKHQANLSSESPYYQKQSNTYIANARLIAAAPEMYEALIMAQRVLLQAGDNEDYTVRTLNDIALVLAKIKGGK